MLVVAAGLVKLLQKVEALEFQVKVPVPVPLATEILRLGISLPLPHGQVHRGYKIVRVLRSSLAVKTVKHAVQGAKVLVLVVVRAVGADAAGNDHPGADHKLLVRLVLVPSPSRRKLNTSLTAS